MRYYKVILLLTIFCLGCKTTRSSEVIDSTKTYNILFIGNSLTYTNNLPKLVKNTAIKKSLKVNTKMIALPNYALIDHWTEGEIQKEIRTKAYDFVIVQQGPSSQAFGREILIEYGKKYNDLCQKNNSMLCFFMVWPSLTYYHTFEGVIKNYKEATILNNSILLPVGEVWKTYFDSTGKLDYYSSDGFHPSLKGSKAAAQVIVEHLLKFKDK